MPLTQPERDNPIMSHYFGLVGLPGKRLAERCRVSHSQIYMARKRNVGADNAEKISRGVAGILGLSEEDRLRLKAEIMGYPGNLVRAYLGDSRKAARLLGIKEQIAAEVLDEGRSVTRRSGLWALKRLREIEAPRYVVESVERRLAPLPEPRPGIVTYTERGPARVEKKRAARESLEHNRPRTHAAIRDSGLKITEVYTRAGIGKETLRKALYGSGVGRRSARAVAAVMREAADLSDAEAKGVEDELMRPPTGAS